MKRMLVVMLSALALPLFAANPPDFNGVWQFNPAKSKNIGMMSGMAIVATVTQSAATLTVKYDSNFSGRKDSNEARFDLSGKSVPNQSQMNGPSETVSRWTDGELVTTWTSEGSVAGTKVTRTETWTLAPDGSFFTVTSRRGNATPVVMVYDRRRQ